MRTALPLLALTVLTGSGCREPVAVAPAGAELVLAAPAAAVGAGPWLDGVVAGARLLLLDPARPDEPPVDLAGGLAAVGPPAIDSAGRRVVFPARATAEDRAALWECAVDGRGRRLLAEVPGEVLGATLLPDGRAAFAATVPDEAGPSRDLPASALFTVAADGGIERITFAGPARDPATLPDGRIVYAQWLPAAEGRPAPGSFVLFTVHPDGSGAAPLHGMHGEPGRARRPRPRPEGGLEHLLLPPGGPPETRLVDWGSPRAACSPARSAAPPRPTVLPAGWRVLDRVPAGPRPRPQGHLSSLRPGTAFGRLLAIDARRDGRGASVRLRTSDGVLGTVPLQADGSFFALVPVDRPLWLDLLDRTGAVLETGRSPFWLRPGENRICVGCHENPETAPPNRRPAAALLEPLDLSAAAAEVGR
ncbi:MAG: hypothetical protein D6702_06385 [Planctomycetota bacterium]|nr:MAG: hypothetical protein D6702_06385 [Planctomycetota bacterium]